MLEICQNAARLTDLATDRRGHDGPSWTPSSHTWCNFFFCFLYSPRWKVWRAVIGTTVRRGSHFKILQLLESGYWDHFSDLHDEPAGRTVIAMTNSHKLRNPTLGQTSPSFFSSCTTLPPTGVGGLFCIFLLKISAFSSGKISCKTKRNLFQN